MKAVKSTMRALVWAAVMMCLLPVNGETVIWEWMNPLSQGKSLEAVWGSSSTDVFAVGAAGTILHYDGTQWSKMNSITTNCLNGVWGSSSTDVFAVGGSGTILHYKGTAWSIMTSGTTDDLYGVWGSSATDVFAVGESGTILHYNGTAWTPMSSITTNCLNGVWGSSSTDVFAVGSSGTILNYNGTDWSAMISGTTDDLYGVWGSSATDVFAVGYHFSYEGEMVGVMYYGTTLYYNGGSWSNFRWIPEVAWSGLSGVWGSSASDVFAVGYQNFSGDFSNGTILHYNGTTWSDIFSDTTEWVNGVWGTSTTDVFAVGSSGTILHYNGTVWSPGTTRNLNDVWGSSATDIFAVGVYGTILNYNGTAWSAMTSGTTNTLAGVWGSSATDIFAVGESGTILHYNGTAWRAMNSSTENDLTGVWGSSATDVFAVGESGTILHYNGTAWSAMSSGTKYLLNSVWGSSATDVFAVGSQQYTSEWYEGVLYEGTILHYNGTDWTEMNYNTEDYLLYSVWGSSATDVFAVGSQQYMWWDEVTYEGTILHYDGTAWIAMSSGTTEWLKGVWGSSATDVFAVGESGTILHYNGTDWSVMNSGTGNDLNGVWSSATVFAVGLNGTILRLLIKANDDAYQTKRNLPLSIDTPGALTNDAHSDGKPMTAVLLNSPTHGNVTLNSNGSFVYTPETDYAGTDSFTYNATDGIYESTGTVTILIIPLITEQKTLSVLENTPYMIILDDLICNDPEYPTGYSLTLHTGDHYTVSGTTIKSETGFSGNLTVPVSVSKGDAVSGIFNLTVKVSPILKGQNPVTVEEDHPLTIKLSDLISNDPGYPTDYTLTVHSGDTYTVSGNQITPEKDFNGTLTVPVSVSKGETTSGIFNLSVTVTPVNDVPVITDQKTLSTLDGIPVAITLDDLTVINLDRPYPTGFELIIMNTDDYNIYENSVIPKEHFTGTMIVLIKVNDGTDDSEVFNLKVDVAAKPDGQWGISLFPSSTSPALNAVWGVSSTDVFAVGDAGKIMHYDGTAWSSMQSGVTVNLRGVWGVSGQYVFAVGEKGTVLFYDGTQWTKMQTGTDATLFGLWGVSKTFVYAAGLRVIQTGSTYTFDGEILLYDGTEWRIVQIVQKNTGKRSVPYYLINYKFTCVIWGTSGYDVRAFGCLDGLGNKSVQTLYSDGTAWSSTPFIVDAVPFSYGLWGNAPDNYVSVGPAGEIYQYDGANWNDMNSGITKTLYGVYGLPSGDIFAVGIDGAILRYDGDQWTKMTSNVIYDLHHITATSDSHLFAVGENGIILHYTEPNLQPDLEKVIAILKCLAGIDVGEALKVIPDINGDGNIGFEELIFMIQKLAGL